MSAGYTNLRVVSYRDTIAELIDRANQTHTRATGVQVFSPGDGMAYEDAEGFINPISPAIFDEAKDQIAEASEALVAAEAELEAAQGRIDETTVLLGQLDEQAGKTSEEVAGVVKDMEADRTRLTAAQADLDALKPRLGDVEGAVSASDAKATQAVSDAAHALQEAQQAREYAEGLDPSTGDGSYSEAMQAAQQAARDALAAMERANLAVTSASGKSSVRNTTTAPQGVGTAPGDTWFQWTAFPGGTVTGQWTWDGAAWRPVTLSHQVLSSVDLGKATVGELEGSYVKAHTIGADRLTIGVGQNAIADPMFSSVDLTNRRISASVGGWTQNRSGALPFVETTGTSTASFQYFGNTYDQDPPTVAGQRWRIQIPVNPGGGRARASVRWVDATGKAFFAVASSYVTGTGDTTISTIWEAPATAVRFNVYVYSPGTSESRTVRVYAGISVQSMTGSVHIEDGAITASKVNAQEVAGAVGQFVKVKAENVEVTNELAARVFSAVTSTVAEQFVTDRLVVGTGDDRTVLEVLGTAVANDLNLRGTLRGRDAILDGTLDVEQLNVTVSMAAEIGRFMSVNTKKLIVTEAAVMQHVTAIEGIITPKITASEAKMGNLIAQKASIADIEGGNLTLTGHFRSGAAGKPGVIIPQNYTTQRGFEQLGIWLAPTGVAPSLGSEWGSTAGIWLDEAANVAGTNARSPLHIRGQSGEGIHIYGRAVIHKAATLSTAILESSAGEALQVQSSVDKNVFVLGRGAGYATLLAEGSGDALVLNSGTGHARLEAKSGQVIVRSTYDSVFLWAVDGEAVVYGKKATKLRTDSNIQLENMDGSAYNRVWTGGGLLSLYIGQSSGTVYRQASSARYKTDIVTMEPDHEWLDLRTVWYRDKAAVECAEAVAARQAAGDTTPITAQEYEMMDAAKRLSPGRIAEEAHTGGAAAQVAYGPDGTPEGYNYERDGTMLIPHVREHRDQLRTQKDKIADLEARIAELESALL